MAGFKFDEDAEKNDEPLPDLGQHSEFHFKDREVEELVARQRRERLEQEERELEQRRIQRLREEQEERERVEAERAEREWQKELARVAAEKNIAGWSEPPVPFDTPLNEPVTIKSEAVPTPPPTEEILDSESTYFAAAPGVVKPKAATSKSPAQKPTPVPSPKVPTPTIPTPVIPSPVVPSPKIPLPDTAVQAAATPQAPAAQKPASPKPGARVTPAAASGSSSNSAHSVAAKDTSAGITVTEETIPQWRVWLDAVEPIFSWLARAATVAGVLALAYILWGVFGGHIGQANSPRAAQNAQNIALAAKILSFSLIVGLVSAMLVMLEEKWLAPSVAILGFAMHFGAAPAFSSIGQSRAVLELI
ncbi:MAG TPA: hypothetical protein VF719_04295, partial [Abditibacteriaceae bacterium]